jgi:TonB family protein
MTAFLSVVIVIFLSSALRAQAPSEQPPAAENVQVRIERARALIAAHRLDTAASELESIRGASQDSALRNVTSVMLMSVYLETANYARAEALLEENFAARISQNGDFLRTYFALTGQAVNGARAHIARYRNSGINTSDPNLPAEAVQDLDRLRGFLERMIAQAKEVTREHKAYDSLSLLEDVVGVRLALARDMEDQSKWQTEYSGARELLNSRTQIASLSGISGMPATGAALKKTSSPSPYSTRRIADTASPNQPATTTQNLPEEEPATDNATEKATVPATTAPPGDTGSLNSKATKRVVPVYPTLARQMGTTGLVRVHVVLDETGKVVEVSKTEGPMLLRRASEDAARQWFFEAPSSDGRPGRWTGYIDFTFTL